MWTLPVCMKSGSETSACQILNSKTETLKVAQAPLFYGNVGGKGYYRSQYDAGDYQKLIAQVETSLVPDERITLLGSEWALARANRTSIGDFLNLASAVKDDPSHEVIGEVVIAIASMDQRLAATTADHQLLAAWVRENFTPVFERLGPPSAADTSGRKELRAGLLALLGNVGDEPKVIIQSKEIAEKYLANPGSGDATLAYAALTVAAQHGDRAFFDRLQQVSETATDPQLRTQALFALARFRDPALVERALQYAVSGKVKDQDSIRFVARELTDRYTQDQAWRFIEEKWPRVNAQFTTLTGATLVNAAGSFCSVQRRTAIADFFQQHKVPASTRALERAQSNIDDCIEFRANQGKNMNQWLAKAVQTQAALRKAGRSAVGD
jgi:aminopeptidase N/puromycin-sensitive aminopeptidase